MSRLTPAELAAVRGRADEDPGNNEGYAAGDRDALLSHIATLEVEREADRAAAMALVEALPKCGQGCPTTIPCDKPATFWDQGVPDTGGGAEPIEHYCAEHAGEWCEDLPYSPALRALVERLKGG